MISIEQSKGCWSYEFENKQTRKPCRHKGKASKRKCCTKKKKKQNKPWQSWVIHYKKRTLIWIFNSFYRAIFSVLCLSNPLLHTVSKNFFFSFPVNSQPSLRRSVSQKLLFYFLQHSSSHHWGKEEFLFDTILFFLCYHYERVQKKFSLQPKYELNIKNQNSKYSIAYN